MKIKALCSKKGICLLVTLMLCLSMLPAGHVTAVAEGEAKSYIIVTADENALQNIEEKIDDTVVDENEILAENDMLVAELTAKEVRRLNKDAEVLFIEEDFEMEANNNCKEKISPDEALAIRAAKLENSNEQGPGKPWESQSIEQFPEYTPEEVKAIKESYHEAMQEKLSRDSLEPEDYEWNMQVVAANDIDEELLMTDIAKTKVAVLDSGVDMVRGIELADTINLVPEEQYVSPLFLDVSGHGTSIASIIAGNPENEVQGVNPDAALYSVKVLDRDNKAPVSRIIEGIYWCIDNDMKIINMSFGTKTYSKALQKAVKDAYDTDILMISAAGNNADDVEYPAVFSEVMAVAATNTSAEISDFSNTGEELEIAAPGEKIKAAGFFGGQIVTEGTSIAAPHVSGAASLLWAKDPAKSNEFIRQLLAYSTRPISNSDDCGLLDVNFALEIYDDFAESWSGEMLVNPEQLPDNSEEPETFEEVDDNESYVEGRWTKPGHQTLAENGMSKNGYSSSSAAMKAVKAGAIHPDEDDNMSGLGSYPEYHGGYTDGGNKINYIACYEFITRIALKNGSSSSFSGPSVVSGLNEYTYYWMHYDFKNANKVGSKTWASVFNKLGISDTNANRKNYTWGIALHILGDIFAHKTYQKKDDLQIVHVKSNSSEMDGADKPEVVARRYKVAKRAIEDSVACLSLNVYGDYLELDYGLKQPLESSDKQNFTKPRLLQYAQANAAKYGVLGNAETNRFTAANR
ncbi:MAG: S8 family serine peptidase [Oscillospiraceae bacterium]|nr:S8 family serine peptidase [Oscillospiraceae bacterium]